MPIVQINVKMSERMNIYRTHWQPRAELIENGFLPSVLRCIFVPPWQSAWTFNLQRTVSIFFNRGSVISQAIQFGSE